MSISHLNSIRADSGVHSAHSEDIDRTQYTDYCVAFSRRQSALNLIKQLHQMVKSVQKHRGMSMAILAGSPLFEGDFAVLQKQLLKRLLLLEEFAAQPEGLLDARDRENLHSAWLTICSDWQDDDVIDNFEFHCHFIEQLHGMIIGLAKGLESPVSSQFDDSEGVLRGELNSKDHEVNYPKIIRDIELLNFLSRELPTMVEFIARIRGLATYAAAKGVCDVNHSGKLKFSITCARDGSKKIRLQAARLSDMVKPMSQSLSSIKEYELKLMFLLEMIERDFLQSDNIAASSHQLFKVTTDIIDVYLNVIEDGWDFVTTWQESDLEKWLLA